MKLLKFLGANLMTAIIDPTKIKVPMSQNQTSSSNGRKIFSKAVYGMDCVAIKMKSTYDIAAVVVYELPLARIRRIEFECIE
jgi:hypothetical protein